MRTKTLLLTAVLGMASVAAALAADPVYSVNAVGYVNVTIPNGFSILANPLKATDNKLSALFPATLPDGTTLYLYRNGGFVICTFGQDDNGNLSWDNDATMLPGEGAFIKNPSTALTVTFVGEVMQSTTGPLATTVPSGFSLLASQVPQSAPLSPMADPLAPNLGYPPADGDVVYLYRNGGYVICTYGQDDNGNLNWDSVPSPNVGEGFWVKTTTGKTWNRTFTVN